MYQTILFDWDGCVLHTLPIWLETYQKVFVENGLPIDEQKIIQQLFRTWDKVDELGITDIKLFRQKVLTSVTDMIYLANLHDHVIDTLQTLKAKGKQHAIVTSSHISLIQKAIDHHQLHTYFDEILTFDDVQKLKPDPEIVYKAMEKLQSKKDSTLIIGDSEVDILAGKAAGITTVLYYPPKNEKFYEYEFVKSLHPDHLIREFAELVDIAQ